MANGIPPGGEPIQDVETQPHASFISIMRLSSQTVENQKLHAITTFHASSNILQVHHSLEKHHWSYQNVTTEKQTKYYKTLFLTYEDGVFRLEPLSNRFEWYNIPVFDIPRKDTENSTNGLMISLKYISRISRKIDGKLPSYIDSIINDKRHFPPISCFRRAYTGARKINREKRRKLLGWRISINEKKRRKRKSRIAK